jgi:DNA excision repair protein ERCC-3
MSCCARTSLTAEEIGEYSGEVKEIRPVTIATYQILTDQAEGRVRPPRTLRRPELGLIIYDEVHLLPAPVFRFTADIQSRRRVGLTATLVREDGRESDVFSLIGPKRFDAPVARHRGAGVHRPADCCEIRVSLPESDRMVYALAEPRTGTVWRPHPRRRPLWSAA